MTPRPVTSLSMLEGFDLYFVEAVLRIRGAGDDPTTEQLRAARAQFDGYYAAVIRTPEPDDVDKEWLDGHTFDSAAAQFAFLYTQFGVIYVSQATADEIAAFTRWWTTDVLPDARTVSAA